MGKLDKLAGGLAGGLQEQAAKLMAESQAKQAEAERLRDEFHAEVRASLKDLHAKLDKLAGHDGHSRF